MGSASPIMAGRVIGLVLLCTSLSCSGPSGARSRKTSDESRNSPNAVATVHADDITLEGASPAEDEKVSPISLLISIFRVRETSRIRLGWELLPNVTAEHAERVLRQQLLAEAKDQDLGFPRAFLVSILAELRGDQFPIFSHEFEWDQEARMQEYLAHVQRIERDLEREEPHRR